jgi:phage-related protein
MPSPILILPPTKWEFSQEVKAQIQNTKLGDGYGLMVISPNSARTTTELIIPNLSTADKDEIIDLFTSYGGITKFRWRPLDTQYTPYNYKEYVCDKWSVIQQGTYLWQITATFIEQKTEIITDTIADGSITTDKIADGAVNFAKLNLSFKLNSLNYLKNPALAVIQGAASGTIPNSLNLPTASLGYPGESEWCLAASGGNPSYVFDRSNQSLTIRGATLTTAVYLLQRLESRDTAKLSGKTVTLSVELSNSQLSTVTWELFRPTTTSDTHGTIATPTQTLIASGTWTVNSTLTRYTATVTLPAEVSNGLEVRLRVGAQTSGTWVIARPKLEEGSSATDFNCGNYSTELLRCLRHFYALNITQDFVWYGELGARGHSPIITFPVEMFSAPITSSTWSNFFNSYVIVGITTTKNSLRTQIGSAASGGAAASLNLTTFLAHIP